MATHSSILAWRLPWTEEPGVLWSIASQRVGHDWRDLAHRLWWFSRCVQLFRSMDCSPPGSSVLGIPRQEYWSGLPFPSPGDLPDPGIEPESSALAGKFSSDWTNSNRDTVISAVWLLRPNLMNGTHWHGSRSSLKQLIVNRIIESCKNMVSSTGTVIRAWRRAVIGRMG